MKPPLQTYDKHPDADAYRVGGFWSPYCLVSENKRFQPGELAAEYWRNAQDVAYIVEGITWEGMCDDWSISEPDALHRAEILDRFATLPHFDEEPA